MRLRVRKLARSQVAFAGVQEYANSGDEDIPILAHVEVFEDRKFGENPPLPFLGPLGAARLLSLLRREPHYVLAFMDLVSAVSKRMLEEGADPSEFSVRRTILTDPAALNAGIETAAILGSGDQALARAALNGSIPVLVEKLPSDAERRTTVGLVQERDGMGSVRFKFGLGSSNALTTIGAWTATVDYLVSKWPREQMAVPIGEGLRVLGSAWDELGNPPGIGISELAEAESLLSLMTAHSTSD